MIKKDLLVTGLTQIELAEKLGVKLYFPNWIGDEIYQSRNL